jgi:hypothetical protein
MSKLNFDFSSSLFSWFREDFERDDSGSFCDVLHVLESVFTIRSIVEIWLSSELNFFEVFLTMALLGTSATIEENSSATTNSLPASRKIHIQFNLLEANSIANSEETEEGTMKLKTFASKPLSKTTQSRNG